MDNSELSDEEDENNQGKNTQKVECMSSNNKRQLEENYLETSVSKKGKDCHNDEVILELQRNDKSGKVEADGEVDNTEHVIMKKVGTNHAQIGRSSRRRPATVVKALTSSNIAEKYDLLLDKRLLLCNYEMAKLRSTVENDNKEHKLRAESLRLDIEFKKKQLQTLEEI